MLGPIKTFFPSVFESIKEWPLWVRVVLFILFVSVPIFFSQYNDIKLLNILSRQFTVTLFQIIAALLFFIIVAGVLEIASKKGEKRTHIYKFCKAWFEYAAFMFRFIEKIQMHEMRNGGFLEFMEKNEKEIIAFHNWVSRLRGLLFKIEERELYIAPNKYWEKLKKNSKALDVPFYLTPFSFVLDQSWLVIASKGEVLSALQISYGLIERLAGKYSDVERLWNNKNTNLEKFINNLKK